MTGGAHDAEHRVLDLVQWPPDEWGERTLAVVVEIRQLMDDTIQYLSSPWDVGATAIVGIHSGGELAATGRRADSSRWALPSGLHVRDRVTISRDFTDEPGVAGTTVTVTDEWDDDSGESVIDVWSDELGSIVSVPLWAVGLPGARLPPDPVPRRVDTLGLDANGQLAQTGAYFIVLDELDQYL